MSTTTLATTTTTTTTTTGWGVSGEDIFESAPVYGNWDRTLHYVRWAPATMPGGKMTESDARAYANELNQREAARPLSTRRA